ncbi:hypothetical protein E2C01_053064 [Portunus trituberculatus]|uniref:Uncharacterized protein n=1 Tax=Portunus trituberculatus TaxID=210409 RepID=A0A5B7GN72_PORTR|nr:hypothetical protein [Portunus trituberculatus]
MVGFLFARVSHGRGSSYRPCYESTYEQWFMSQLAFTTPADHSPFMLLDEKMACWGQIQKDYMTASLPPAGVRRPNFTRGEMLRMIHEVKPRLPVITDKLDHSTGQASPIREMRELGRVQSAKSPE